MIGHNQIIRARRAKTKPTLITIDCVEKIPNDPYIEKELSMGLTPNVYLERGEVPADFRFLMNCKVMLTTKKMDESLKLSIARMVQQNPSMLVVIDYDKDTCWKYTPENKWENFN